MLFTFWPFWLSTDTFCGVDIVNYYEGEKYFKEKNMYYEYGIIGGRNNTPMFYFRSFDYIKYKDAEWLPFGEWVLWYIAN